MISFLQINIEGFGSIIDPVTLPLNLGGIIRVSGANGMGKTSMFSALAWALFGKNLKGVSEVNTWKELRPKNYLGTKVEVTWQSDTAVYKVIRCQNYTGKLEEDNVKGGNRLLFYSDGTLTNNKGKVTIQNEINVAIGFSYELFINSIMFGQGMKRLIQESNADKKKLFEEVFKLDYLNTARTNASNERNYILSISKDLTSEISHIEDRISSETETYNDVKEQQKEFKKIIKNEKVQLTDDLVQIDKNLDSLESKYDNTIESSYEKYKTKLVTQQNDLKKANSIRNIPVIDVVNEILTLMEKKDYSEAYNKLTDIRKSFNNCDKIQRDIEKTTAKLNEYRTQLRKQDQYWGEIKRLKAQKEKIQLKLKNLTKRTPPELDSKFKHKIITLKRKLTELQGKAQEVAKDLENYNWILNDPLSNQGLKAYLFDSCLAQLNHNLERYSEVLGFRIEFNIDLDSSRKEFVTLIEKDGVIAEYDELSGGEKALVNLTMCLALHETLTLSKDVNILLLDEVFENLCRDNIELVISLIKDFSQSKTVFLISHLENLPFGNCRNLVVSKENGSTHYKGI